MKKLRTSEACMEHIKSVLKMHTIAIFIFLIGLFSNPIMATGGKTEIIVANLSDQPVEICTANVTFDIHGLAIDGKASGGLYAKGLKKPTKIIQPKTARKWQISWGTGIGTFDIERGVFPYSVGYSEQKVRKYLLELEKNKVVIYSIRAKGDFTRLDKLPADIPLVQTGSTPEETKLDIEYTARALTEEARAREQERAKQNPLFTAIYDQNADLNRVKELINQKDCANCGVNFVYKGGTYEKEGATPLMAAVMKGRLDIVKLLLDNGADVNAATPHSMTALLHACRLSDLKAGFDIAKLLVDRNANIKDTASLWHAIYGAMDRGNVALVKLLRDRGEKVMTTKQKDRVQEWLKTHSK